VKQGVDSVEGVQGVLYQVRAFRAGLADSAALHTHVGVSRAWVGPHSLCLPLHHVAQRLPSLRALTMHSRAHPLPATPQVAETLSDEILTKMHAPPKAADVPIIDPHTLPEVRAAGVGVRMSRGGVLAVATQPVDNHPRAHRAHRTPQADGFAFGFPTRFGMMAGQMKCFWDATGSLWAKGALVGGASGTRALRPSEQQQALKRTWRAHLADAVWRARARVSRWSAPTTPTLHAHSSRPLSTPTLHARSCRTQVGKAATMFTSTASQGSGQETTIMTGAWGWAWCRAVGAAPRAGGDA
jgi:hypothetical protein